MDKKPTIRSKNQAIMDAMDAGGVTVWRKQAVLEHLPEDPAQILTAIGDHLWKIDTNPGEGLHDELEFEALGHIFTVTVKPSPDHPSNDTIEFG